MFRSIVLAAAVVLACAAGVQAEVVIETVAVGNPGNVDDTHGDGYGGVSYFYNVGKYEVTAGQYTEFLNAVARTDSYGLYHLHMANIAEGILGCNIQRTGSSGGYEYSVADDWADRPVNYISWGDAARFANWLHNGQPTGDQDVTTTEDGSYYLNGATSDAELMGIVREPDATWVIPSEDEWYKAAYYDGDTAAYDDYPTSHTQSGTQWAPTSEPPPGTDMAGGSANYLRQDVYAIGSPYYRTEVGAYDAKPSDSFYGTFDQGGNVWEWNEAVCGDSFRGFRGGAFASSTDPLRAEHRNGWYPTTEGYQYGFRVAEVPDPERIADFNHDGDVDLHDFAVFQRAITGPR